MLNYTVDPVASAPEIIAVANKSTLFFRRPEFSDLMKENEQMIFEMLNTPKNSRRVFLTASGTGAIGCSGNNYWITKSTCCAAWGFTSCTSFECNSMCRKKEEKMHLLKYERSIDQRKVWSNTMDADCNNPVHNSSEINSDCPNGVHYKNIRKRPCN